MDDLGVPLFVEPPIYKWMLTISLQPWEAVNDNHEDGINKSKKTTERWSKEKKKGPCTNQKNIQTIVGFHKWGVSKMVGL